MHDSFTLYLFRLNTDVELCQSLRRLLADDTVMRSLDPETRYLLMLIDLYRLSIESCRFRFLDGIYCSLLYSYFVFS